MKTFILSLLILVLNLNILRAQHIEPFQKGDRVVFVGNSITDGGHYHSYIWLYYMTRFPDRRINIFNAGIGGDVARQIYDRLQDDVFSRKPTYMALTFGMNDTDYFIYHNPKADSISQNRISTSYNSYLDIERELKRHPEIKKVVITSSPYDETVKFENNYFPGKSAAMLSVAEFQEASAKANGWGFVDFNRSMTGINIREQKRDPKFTLCGEDRIHPGNDGHLVMAYLFLKAQGLSGNKIADVHIDAGQKRIVTAENCTVTLLSSTKEAMRFDYLAKALPFPVDTSPRGWNEKKAASDALRVIPFIDEFNQETIKLTGLKPGHYRLKIDDAEIGTWTAAELAAGINLATLTRTPQYQQALTIMALNEERFEKERELRRYAWLQYSFFREKGLMHADNLAALDTLNKAAQKNIFVAGNRDNYMKSRFRIVRDTWKKEIDLLVNEIYAINKPVEHRIEIERTGN